MRYTSLVRILLRDFYNRKTDIVARNLLGKILVRKLDEKLLGGVIVETEAYFVEMIQLAGLFMVKKSITK